LSEQLNYGPPGLQRFATALSGRVGFWHSRPGVMIDVIEITTRYRVMTTSATANLLNTQTEVTDADQSSLMSATQKQAIAELRDRGFAVVVFSPEELGCVSRDRLESRLVADGNEHIEDITELENN